MAESFGDKTQEATPHRRQQAREQGQIAKSQDLASAVVLLGALMALYWFGTRVMRAVVELFSTARDRSLEIQIDTEEAVAQWNHVVGELASALLPLLLVMVLIASLAHVGQSGFLFLPQKLAFDWSRISPLAGAKRLFSISSWARLGFGVVKVLIVAFVGIMAIYGRHELMMSLAELDIRSQVAATFDIVFWTCIQIAVALLVLAIIDYGFQRWKHEQDLRMTNQEVREEFKNLQGDPQVMARRRQVQRQLVMNRLSSTIPQATAVVTNPTELAIAIRYEPETMDTPIVIAKGAGVLAARIRKLALESSVPVVERKELARALYRTVDVNQPVPSEQYAAVAEVLQYVYQLQGRPLPGQAA